MLIKPDCLPCIMKMAVGSAEKLQLPLPERRRFLGELAWIFSTPTVWDMTSPEIISRAMDLLIRLTGRPDPFLELKNAQNQRALTLYPALKAEVDGADDPLAAALDLAALGNSIDLMWEHGFGDAAAVMSACRQSRLPEGAAERFRQRLAGCAELVYLADNCGEIVFDRILLETLYREHPCRVSFIVRSRPAMNDATLAEAAAIGLPEFCRIIPNGIAASLPGTIIAACSREVRELIARADWVLAKGGGNFDSLGQEPEAIKKNISCLLVTKCRPYQECFKRNLGDPVLIDLAQGEQLRNLSCETSAFI